MSKLTEEELKALKAKVIELHNAEVKAKDKQIASNIGLWAEGKELPDSEDQEPKKSIEEEIEAWSKTQTPGYL